MPRCPKLSALALAVSAASGGAGAADHVWQDSDYFIERPALPTPIGAADTVTAVSPAPKSLSASLTNDGRLIWNATADLVLPNGGTVLRNNGWFEGLTDVQMRARQARTTLDNAGVLRKGDGAGNWVLALEYVQRAGAVSDAHRGVIRYERGGVIEGGRFIGERGAHELAGSFVFTGAFDTAGATVRLDGGSFRNASASRLDATGNLAWGGGRLQGSWGVARGRELLLYDGSAARIVDGDFTNDGVVRWAGSGDLTLGDAGVTFRNNGLLEIAGDADLTTLPRASSTMVNTGTMRKTAGDAATTITTRLVNTGTIESSAGTVELPPEWTNDGTLRGTAGFATGETSWLHNAGDIAPGTDGGDHRLSTLRLDGSLAQERSGRLSFDVAAGGLSDLLAVTGDVALDGTLRVLRADGYVPRIGDVFTVMSFARASGLERLDVDAVGFGDATRFSAQIVDGTRLVLSVAAVPEPSTWLLMALGLPMLAAVRRRVGAAPAA